MSVARGISLVVLLLLGGQRNGVVVVPANRTNCMTSHESQAPPLACGRSSSMVYHIPLAYEQKRQYV